MMEETIALSNAAWPIVGERSVSKAIKQPAREAIAEPRANVPTKIPSMSIPTIRDISGSLAVALMALPIRVNLRNNIRRIIIKMETETIEIWTEVM